MAAGEAGLNGIDQSCSQPSPRRPRLPDNPGSRVTPGGSKRPARLVFYSHDAQGLGHIRRNLNIANYLINAGLDATILLICGTRWISRLNLSAAIDTLILPALRKHSDGSYEPRHLQIDQSQLMECRRQTILAAVKAFDPDLLVVDKLPLGFQNELQPTLEYMRDRAGRCILGLRDIIDDPEVARQEWQQMGGNQATDNLYDEVWVYGDRSVHNLSSVYQFSDRTRLKTQYTGYLNPLDLGTTVPRAGAGLDPEREEAPGNGSTVLCLVGGGQDGYDLARLFLKADLGKQHQGIIVTGPYMSEDHRNKLRNKAKSRKRGRFQVLEFLPSLLPLMRQADLVVSLGGYNTLCEILAVGVPALVVPRVVPRREQLVRAEAFHRLGLVDYLHPEAANREAISSWIQHGTHGRVNAASALNFSGFATISRQVESMLAHRYSQP